MGILTRVLNARLSTRMEDDLKHGVLSPLYSTDKLHYKGPQQMIGCHLVLLLMVNSTTVNWLLSSRRTQDLVCSRDSVAVQGACTQNSAEPQEGFAGKMRQAHRTCDCYDNGVAGGLSSVRL